MTRRVMLDIETWGTTPGCAIESIGLVEFGPGRVGDACGVSVSLSSCREHDLTTDDDTIEWMHDQREQDVDALREGRALAAALERVAAFLPFRAEVWAKPPAFDCVLLARAYRACGYETPWDHWRTRDVRTARDLAGDAWPDIDQDGPKHEAVGDARYQARQLAGALAALDGGGSE
jgi:hypothetical protein